jgi:hypothetical protein
VPGEDGSLQGQSLYLVAAAVRRLTEEGRAWGSMRPQ